METINTDFKSLFIRLSIVLNILPYYGYTHKGAWLMRQLCKQSREIFEDKDKLIDALNDNKLNLEISILTIDRLKKYLAKDLVKYFKLNITLDIDTFYQNPLHARDTYEFLLNIIDPETCKNLTILLVERPTLRYTNLKEKDYSSYASIETYLEKLFTLCSITYESKTTSNDTGLEFVKLPDNGQILNHGAIGNSKVYFDRRLKDIETFCVSGNKLSIQHCANNELKSSMIMIFHMFYRRYVEDNYELTGNQTENLKKITLSFLSNSIADYTGSMVDPTFLYLQKLNVDV